MKINTTRLKKLAIAKIIVLLVCTFFVSVHVSDVFHNSLTDPFSSMASSSQENFSARVINAVNEFRFISIEEIITDKVYLNNIISSVEHDRWFFYYF